MRSSFLLSAVVPALWLGGAQQAAAHSPYLSQQQPIGDSGHEIALWVGDGIIGPDPMRAVVLDAEGRIVAASPRSDMMVIECEAADTCIAFDRMAGRAYRPEPGSFQTREPIMQGENLFGYPEDYKDEFGFSISPMTTAEYLGVESRRLFSAPILTVIASLWWTAIWLILVLGVKFLRSGRALLTVRILAASITTTTAGFLGFVSVVLWGLAPTSLTILLAHAVIGGLLAWLIVGLTGRQRQPALPAAR